MHDTTYGYYQNGQLQCVNYDGAKVAEYSYNAVGLLSRIDRFNAGVATGAWDEYSYDANDPRNLLKTITMHYKDAAGQPASSVIDYTDGSGSPDVDKAGNLLSMTDLAGHWVYTYDHGGRVASITPPNPVPEQGLGGTYGYNWLGQLVNPPAEPNHLQYNAAGLPSLWPGLYSYTYKSNGAPDQVKNPSGTSVIAATVYDSVGFPVSFSMEGNTHQFETDADGALIGYTQTEGGSRNVSQLADPTSPLGSVLLDDASGAVVGYVCDAQGRVVASVSSGMMAHHHIDATGCSQLSTTGEGRVGVVPQYAGPKYPPSIYTRVRNLTRPPAGLEPYTPPSVGAKPGIGDYTERALEGLEMPGARFVMGPNSTESYNHFLSGTGSLHRIDASDLIRTVPSAKRAFEAEFYACRNTVLAADLDPGTYYFQSTKAVPEKNLIVQPWESKDWNLTLQHYQAWGEAEVSVLGRGNSQNVSIQFKWRIHDWYKWHDRDGTPVFETQARLHDTGLAREFLNIGVVSRESDFVASTVRGERFWYSFEPAKGLFDR